MLIPTINNKIMIDLVDFEGLSRLKDVDLAYEMHRVSYCEGFNGLFGNLDDNWIIKSSSIPTSYGKILMEVVDFEAIAGMTKQQLQSELTRVWFCINIHQLITTMQELEIIYQVFVEVLKSNNFLNAVI